MKLTAPEIQKRMDHCVAVLQHAGVKLTHQRLEIYREVAQTEQHPNVEAVFKGVRQRLPTLALDTVYRTLLLFQELGLMDSLSLPREPLRFDANLAVHHHFVCTRCGLVRDFYSLEFDALLIPEAVQTIGSVEKAQVEFRGVCSNCNQKHDRKKTNSKGRR